MKALDRKLLRDLRLMWSQALTIALVVASGIAGFVTSLSAVDSLALARDRFYIEGRFADVFAGIKRAPDVLVDVLRDVDGVADVQTTLQQFVRVEIEGVPDPIIGQLIGVDSRRPAHMNRVTVSSGRGLDSSGPRADGALEALVNEGFARARGLKPGDRLVALINGKRRHLVVAGTALSPEFVFAGLWGMPAAAIDAVVLTHAHIDHSGFLPRLVKLGFRGRVYTTAPTKDLCALLLPDSGRLMEEEADYANRHGFSKHKPALPLFDEADALRALEHIEVRDFERAFEPVAGMHVRFSRAGHILGAASVRLEAGGRSVLFSGDLGRADDEVMCAPAPPPASDGVVVESTYGDRLHAQVDADGELAFVINRTVARGGMVLIPSFAVARAQGLLHLIARLKDERRIPDLPVYLNSPMAADVTRLYRRWRVEHRLDDAQCARMCSVAKIVNTVEESKRLNGLRFPSVIVSASGMATGGRVVHHLKAYAPDPRNAIVLAGFQAAGTRGAALAAGEKSIKIHGAYVPVRAEVVQLDALSAHADRDGLLAWLGALPAAPRAVFVTHGEPVAADALRLAIEERYGWEVVVPDDRQVIDLA